MKKVRMDVLLVERGLAGTLNEAQRLIMAGLAIADDKRIDKPGFLVPYSSVLRLKNRIPFVSRGGFKLQGAIDVFSLNMAGSTVLDIGASTGGFTDAALKNGALEVFAVDVGEGLIHNSLRCSPKVKVIDKTNFRNIEFNVIGKTVDFIVTDVSFISLKLIIPPSVQFCKEGTIFIPLIKPQFEAMREEVGKGGIVTDREVHRRVCLNIAEYAAKNGFTLRGLAPSPIKGAKGNVEYLAFFVYDKCPDGNFNEDIIKQIL